MGTCSNRVHIRKWREVSRVACGPRAFIGSIGRGGMLVNCWLHKGQRGARDGRKSYGEMSGSSGRKEDDFAMYLASRKEVGRSGPDLVTRQTASGLHPAELKGPWEPGDPTR